MTALFGTFEVEMLPEDDRTAYQEAQPRAMTNHRAYFSGTEVPILRMYVGTMPASCTPTYRKLVTGPRPSRHGAPCSATCAVCATAVDKVDGWSWRLRGRSPRHSGDIRDDAEASAMVYGLATKGHI